MPAVSGRSTESSRPPAMKFERIALQAIASRHRVKPFERGNRPRDHLYASQLGACARAVWYSWAYPDVRPDDNFSETRGALGHAVEGVLAEQLNGIVVAREVSFYDEARHVSGRVDFIVRLVKDGPMIPVELKTTLAYDRFLAEPMASHLLQLRYYLTQVPEAPFGILVYYNLSGWGGKMGEWTALEIPRDDASVTEQAARLWRVVRQKEPPACEHHDDKDGCWDCSHSAEVVLKGGDA